MATPFDIRSSKIRFHYFDFPGRGAFVQFLLEDANLDYEFVKVPVETWKEHKSKMIDLGIPVPTVPYLTINDKYMGKTNPTMRYLSKQLGEYTADNDLYEHYLDSMADLCRDWFNAWVTPHYLTKPNGPAEEEYQANVAPLYHNGVEKELGKNNSGPYILGEKITYVDFLIYHTMVDDQLRSNLGDNTYPHLKKLAEAIESRPNLKNYLNKQ